MRRRKQGQEEHSGRKKQYVCRPGDQNEFCLKERSEVGGIVGR